MTVNASQAFQSDTINYIDKKVLPLSRRQLVAYQFGDPLTLPEGMGNTYTATRYNRLPLPFAPLSEGVPPIGETMTIQQVTATAQQWGDKVTITDVAEITIFHPLFQKGIELSALQISETLERNTFNALMACTQVNYVNSRGSRAALVAGDVLDTTTVIRTDAALETLGAPVSWAMNRPTPKSKRLPGQKGQREPAPDAPLRSFDPYPRRRRFPSERDGGAGLDLQRLEPSL